MPTAVLSAIARYPVKSMLGERLTFAALEPRGLVGDRFWAVVDSAGRLGSGKTTRRFRRMAGLLDYRATQDAAGRVSVEAPGGRVFQVDDPEFGSELSQRLGMPVTVRRESSTMHFDEGPVSLMTSTALRSIGTEHGAPVDGRRFRTNLLVELDGSGYPEDTWVGQDIAIGEVVLRGRNRLQRCAVITLSQTDLPADSRLLRTVADTHDLEFALLADVVRPGTVRVGDTVRVGA